MQSASAPNGSTSVGDPRPLIEARDLTKQFGGLRAVDAMSIALGHGEMLGLIGPNGAGKTTLFNLLAGSLKPTSGTISIDGGELSREGPEGRIARGVGRTFQIPRPFPEMTVLENVLTGGQDQAGEHIWKNFLRPAHVAAQEKAAVEKARGLLELARILMADPQAILLDEPAAGVNPTLLELIVARVLDLNARGKSILLIEHNMEMVSRLCDRVVVMAAGRHLTEGAPAEVARNPAVIDAYLGGVT
jgi:branched-chain amino acid transport system ATP-binding protein